MFCIKTYILKKEKNILFEKGGEHDMCKNKVKTCYCMNMCYIDVYLKICKLIYELLAKSLTLIFAMIKKETFTNQFQKECMKIGEDFTNF